MTQKDNIDLFFKENGQLYLEKDQKIQEVQVKKCFPKTHSREFLSFRDDLDNEVYLLPSLNMLGEKSRETLKKYLDKSEFIQVIKKVFEVEEGVELRNFKVQFDQMEGSYNLQTHLDEWPTKKEDGSLLLKDINGDLFKIESADRLDSNSAKIVETFIN